MVGRSGLTALRALVGVGHRHALRGGLPGHRRLRTLRRLTGHRRLHALGGLVGLRSRHTFSRLLDSLGLRVLRSLPGLGSLLLLPRLRVGEDGRATRRLPGPGSRDDALRGLALHHRGGDGLRRLGGLVRLGGRRRGDPTGVRRFGPALGRLPGAVGALRPAVGPGCRSVRRGLPGLGVRRERAAVGRLPVGRGGPGLRLRTLRGLRVVRGTRLGGEPGHGGLSRTDLLAPALLAPGGHGTGFLGCHRYGIGLLGTGLPRTGRRGTGHSATGHSGTGTSHTGSGSGTGRLGVRL
ncbi:hypothetical protein H1R13_29255 [Streptomyces mexicanus]|uniref:Uncharacterized protein n=1 Tax=Streptomyces mexicanus TaxID=178566 RepID=A0A7X1I5Z1_9ACTN|nr:hypothetical protein [Streptomyces mexicanus]